VGSDILRQLREFQKAIPVRGEKRASKRKTTTEVCEVKKERRGTGAQDLETWGKKQQNNKKLFTEFLTTTPKGEVEPVVGKKLKALHGCRGEHGKKNKKIEKWALGS